MNPTFPECILATGGTDTFEWVRAREKELRPLV